MRNTTIPDAATVVLALQDEIRRSEEARYDHRLHALLLMAEGMSARETAVRLGDAPRTVAYWRDRFIRDGLAGLVDEERSGRPRRLSSRQMEELEMVLKKAPHESGMNRANWDGKTLSSYVLRKWGINLCVRQCQRLFRQLGFRLRKPRPLIAHADKERQVVFKKNEMACEKEQN